MITNPHLKSKWLGKTKIASAVIVDYLTCQSGTSCVLCLLKFMWEDVPHCAAMCENVTAAEQIFTLMLNIELMWGLDRRGDREEIYNYITITYFSQ